MTPNNFNLIRLAAALQVLFGHWGAAFREPHLSRLYHHVAEPFPGVPIFFFTSGFLIAQSFRRSDSVWDFYRRRVLRIYPAMLVCLAACVLGMVVLGYPGIRQAGWRSIVAWLAAQATIFQKYEPPWLKINDNWLNSPLWTVMVELQFYAITPVLLARKGISSRWRLGWMAAIFLGASLCFDLWPKPAAFLGHLIWVGILDSFVPTVWMFLIGAWCSENKDILIPAVRRWPWWVAPALVAVLWLVPAVGFEWSIILQFPLLAALVLKLAYADPTLADRTIGGTDISYGTYIYHCPMMTLAIYAGYGPRLVWVMPALVLLVAAISWQFVEKPALSLKNGRRQFAWGPGRGLAPLDG